MPKKVCPPKSEQLSCIVYNLIIQQTKCVGVLSKLLHFWETKFGLYNHLRIDMLEIVIIF